MPHEPCPRDGARIAELDDYIRGDPIPAPEAIEKNTETVWALFSELAGLEQGASASPADQAREQACKARDTDPGGIAAHSPPVESASIEPIIATAALNGRLYPTRPVWEELVGLLTDHAGACGAASPMPLLPHDALPTGSDLAWKMCFHGHIEWAATHGCLPIVREFLGGLREQDWEHRPYPA